VPLIRGGTTILNHRIAMDKALNIRKPPVNLTGVSARKRDDNLLILKDSIVRIKAKKDVPSKKA
jgi:hypothetical protein